MIHIFYPGIGEESATRLSKHLDQLGAKNELHWAKEGDFKKGKDDLCVNWGSPRARKFGNAAPWLNKGVVLNKLLHFEQMKAAGVPIPTFVKGSRPTSGTWLGRQLQHWDGNDLEKKLTTADYWVERVEIKDEYRVHCFKGKVLRASLKVPVERWTYKGKVFTGKANPNFRIGDFWGTSDKDYAAEIPKLCAMAAAAVTAVGYDFGGVDVATLRGGGAVVFEVNSAPWLGGDAATKYAKLIIAEAKK